MNKMFSGLIALLIASSPAFSQTSKMDEQNNNFDQGHAVKSHQMMAAYNAPARIDVKGAWDLYVKGSFIYWNVSEENLELAISDANGVGLPIQGRPINVDFEYKPGFKVSLGANFEHDDWDGCLTYTRLHQTSGVSSSPEQPSGTLYPLWFHPSNVETVSQISSKWKLDLDVLDFQLARSYYVGTHLTYRMHFGGRAIWLDQDYNVNAISTIAANREVTSTNSSTSWGIGPRAGLETNWILGWGFRLSGNAAADLVYTSYKVKQQQQDDLNPAGVLALDFKDKMNFLRPHNEFQVGLGWGTYLDNNNWHIDLSASYDFHIFWNQNVFRQFIGSGTNAGNSIVSYGDLYMHGLTASARFDF